MNKIGATQWTMAKLITVILAVALLAIVVTGAYGQGFGPLFENIGNRYDEVLIFLGAREDPFDIKCGDSFEQNIDGVGEGEFFPCDNKCEFVLDGSDGLLDYNKFVLDGQGFSADNKGVVDRDEAYSVGVSSAEGYRKEYLEIEDMIDDFLASEEMDKDDFVEIMGFNAARSFYFEVGANRNNWKERLHKTSLNLFSLKDSYEHRGISWNDAKFDGEIFDNLVNAYGRGYNIYYGYKSVPELKRDISRYKFKKWFFDLIEGCSRYSIFSDVSDKGDLQIGDGDEVLLSYNCISDDIESWESFLINLYNRYVSGEDLYWYYKNERQMHYLVSNELVESRVLIPDGLSEDVFRSNIMSYFEEYKNSYDAVQNMKKMLLDSGNFDIEFINVNGDYIFSVIFPKGERLGVYYQGGEVILVDRFLEKSVVSDFVDLSDGDWDDLIKINRIYEYFKFRGCVNE